MLYLLAMRVFLVGDSKTGIDFFPELESFLLGRVVGLEVQSVIVPFPEDVPAAVKSVLGEADLVFVFVLYEELDFKIKALLNRLVDLEMDSGSKIVKAVEESDLGALTGYALEAKKSRLAEQWGSLILSRLFGREPAPNA